MEDKGLLKSVFGNFTVQPSDDLVLSLLLKPLTNRMVWQRPADFLPVFSSFWTHSWTTFPNCPLQLGVARYISL